MPQLAHDHEETQARAVTRYRITPWPIRTLIPLAAVVLIAGILHNDTAPGILIPLVVVAATAYVVAGERIGLYCSTIGFESRMTRRQNTFRYEWAEIDRFEVVEYGAQVAIVMHLKDGSRRLLPSTKAWRFQRSLIIDISAELNHRLQRSN
jgi:hypothetical protein